MILLKFYNLTPLANLYTIAKMKVVTLPIWLKVNGLMFIVDLQTHVNHDASKYSGHEVIAEI